jgi:glutathione S-transferase
VKLYDAARCPFCARVRLALAEKGLLYEPVAIDLGDRPTWIYDLNPLGKVPVLEDDGLVLPESAVIMEYLDERHPDPPLLPVGGAERARARLAVWRFDDLLGDEYYALRRGEENRVAEQLDAVPVGDSLFVDLAFLPWVMRLEVLYGVSLPERLEGWWSEMLARPAARAELEIVEGLA